MLEANGVSVGKRKRDTNGPSSMKPGPEASCLLEGDHSQRACPVKDKDPRYDTLALTHAGLAVETGH